MTRLMLGLSALLILSATPASAADSAQAALLHNGESPAGETGASFAAANSRDLVSTADLVYDRPVQRPVEGQPIGNGRMGTLVWTSPGAVHLQINRNDVFAVNRNHAGAQFGPTDICGGCAAVVVDVGGSPFAAEPTFTQRLSLYDAETQLAGAGVSVRCFVASQRDVLVMEIDDQRAQPQPVRVNASLWRAPEVVTEDHTARFHFSDAGGRLVVAQTFAEQDYHCASAVAIGFAEAGTELQPADERSRLVVAPARRGKRILFLASAASLGGDKAADSRAAVAAALGQLAAVETCSYAELREGHLPWWHQFWSRTFVRLTSPDGAAEAVQRVRYRHLYSMAASSRGTLPPKWNGSLFATAGDERQWGSQYWVWTMEMLYFPLLAADAIDLTDPFFEMYVRQLPACEIAARQRWGSRGAYFPETTAFDGPTELPDDAAVEFQDVLLGRKAAREMSPRAFASCRFDSHLSAVTQPHKGRFSWISHVTSSGSELAVHAWWRYRYTGDRSWLRTHAYPLLRGTVEFYRHLAKKEADGRYHLAGTNAHEDFWGVGDSIMDLAAIRGTVPLAICAAEILDVDPELRASWSEFLENVAPYVMGDDPRARALTGGVLAEDVWAAGYRGEIDGQNNPEDVWLTPVFPFEDWTLETRDPTVDALVQKTLDLAPRHASVLQGAGLSTAIRTPIAVARAGRGKDLPQVLERYHAAFAPLPNGMSLFEGPTAPSVEHLGLLTTTLQEALVQSVSPRPGEQEVIRVFPAWPDAWDASFRLLARGGFLVSSEIAGGQVRFVEIESRLGEECRLRNPWQGECVVSEVDRPDRVLAGESLRFPTAAGQRFRLNARP